LKKTISEQVTRNMEKYGEWYKEKIKGNEDNPDVLNQAELELYKKIIEGNDEIDLNLIIDHIVHIVEIGGIECVGLGSDFDGIPSTPSDLTDVSCYPLLVSGLSGRGFNNREIQKIMGLNLFSFFKRFDK
jgi:microsomal dipeptidase-like Zn-dependent dipeptidase